MDEVGKRFAELSTFKREADERAAAVPAKAEDYKFTLPDELKDLKSPDGKDYQVDEKNPLLAEFRSIAHEAKLAPAEAQKLFSAFVKSKADEFAAVRARIGEEQKKLGGDAAARVTAIETFLKAHVGDAPAAALRSGLFTAAQVQAFETLMKKFEGGGVAPFTPKGADSQDEAGKIAGYENMNFVQRRAAQDARRAQG